MHRKPRCKLDAPKRHVVKRGLDWISKTWTGFVKHGFVKGGFVKHGFVKGGFVKHGFVKHGFVKRWICKTWICKLVHVLHMFYKGGKKRKGYEEPVVMLVNFNLFCHKQCQLPV